MAYTLGPEGQLVIQAIVDAITNSSRVNMNRNQATPQATSSFDRSTRLSKELDDILEKSKKISSFTEDALEKSAELIKLLRESLQSISDGPEAAKYKKNLQAALASEEKNRKELEDKLLQYKINLWNNLSIEQKAYSIKEMLRQIDDAVKVYEKKKELIGRLTADEKSEYAKLTEEKTKYDKLYFAIQKSLAREGSRQDRYSNYTREVNRIKEELRALEALNRAENEKDPEKRRLRTQEINLNAKNAIRQVGELYGVTRGQDTTTKVAGVVENVAGVISGGPSGIANTIESMLGKASPVVSAIMAVLKVVGSINQVVGLGIQRAVNAETMYMGSINARMQQTLLDNENYYKESLGKFTAIAGDWNSFVSKTGYVEKLNELVLSGIAYNVEERAMIAELSNRMVTTFDALDASLTRLVRILQRDMTYAALGSEALITEFLNALFKDTSYLNNMYDQVSGILLDATAKMSADLSAAFSYEVQKWLGSLYSVGLSESGVLLLAQGLTYLATGDVSLLTNNLSLQYIYAAAAERGGMSLADILVSGLDIDTTNNLLKNVVSLLSDVYSTSSTNPVLSAWASITGMSIADLRSVLNLNQYMSNISSSHASWVDQVEETLNQLALIEDTSRTGTALLIENLINNALLSLGESVINSTYTDDFLGINESLGIVGLSKYLGYYLGNLLGGAAGSLLLGLSIAPSLINSLKTGLNTISGSNEVNFFSRTGNPLSNILSSVASDLLFDQAASSLSLLGNLMNYEYLVASVLSGNISPDMLDSYLAAIESSASSVSASQSNLPSLVRNAETAAAVASAVVNESSEDRALLSEAVDVQDYIFENELTIRVTLALVEDRAAVRLAEALNIEADSENLEAIKTTVQSKVNVDLVDNDVSTLINNIYSTKWSM